MYIYVCQNQNTKRWKQSSAIKKLLETVPRHKDVHWLHHRWYERHVCSITSEQSQSTQSEALLIASTLLVVKTENIYRKQTLFLAIKMCTGFAC